MAPASSLNFIYNKCCHFPLAANVPRSKLAIFAQRSKHRLLLRQTVYTCWMQPALVIRKYGHNSRSCDSLLLDGNSHTERHTEREREKASSLSEDLRVKYFVQSNFGRVSDRICQFCATHACHGTSDLYTERKLLIQLKRVSKTQADFSLVSWCRLPQRLGNGQRLARFYSFI